MFVPELFENSPRSKLMSRHRNIGGVCCSYFPKKLTEISIYYKDLKLNWNFQKNTELFFKY